MALNKTTQAENDVLDYLLRTRDPAVYLALFTSDPGESGSTAGEPATANGYARQAITFAAASGGATSNTNAPAFTANATGWGTITHVGVCRSATRGTADLIYHGPATAARTVLANQGIDVAAGEVDISEE